MSFVEPPAATGSSQLESSILRWRQRALDFVLYAGIALGTVPLLLVFLPGAEPLPLGLRLTSLAVYALVIVLALARSAPHDLRAWGLFSALLTLAAVMLAARGLEGGGRLFLVVVPLFATVLLGPRSGYVAAALSLALYTAAAVLLSAAGRWRPVAAGHADSAKLWLLQGALLVLVTAPVVVLVNQFVRRLWQAIAAERAAADRIVRADSERRRLERALLETGERERRAVGHQLHDGPCQQITAALLRCKVAHNALSAGGAHAEAAHLQAISELLDASVAEIHDLARGLSPAALSPGALVAALDGLARRVRASGAVECELVHDGAARAADVELSSQLFRIAQEAVTNALRHAHARRISIELARCPEGDRLLIRDDGVGFAPDGNRDGMGLRIMRYRSELIGGSFAIGAAPGRGTLVTCTLPLPEAGARREARA